VKWVDHEYNQQNGNASRVITQIQLLLFSGPFSILRCPVKQKRCLLRSSPPGITGLMRMDGEGYACKVRAFSVFFLPALD
jgi:hypothetical protein